MYFRMRPALVFVLGLVLASCAPESAEKQPTSRVEEMTLGPVSITISTEPGVVRLDRDVLMTIRIACPSEIEVVDPALEDRVQGFSLSGFFAEEPARQDGRTVYEYQARLTPHVAEEYRLAPMAIEYIDRSDSPATSGWMATRPIVFEVDALQSGSGVQTDVQPVWIRPSFVTVLWWVIGALLAIGALYGIWRLARRVKHAVELRRMSPRERAMRELDILLARDLPGQQKVKEFYLELTMVVRRYIERRHGIRAPEQTTEEFLIAVQGDPRFGRDVVNRLQNFLEAADLVKFAAYHPEGRAIDDATETARDYIRTDDAAAEARMSEPGDTTHGEQ